MLTVSWFTFCKSCIVQVIKGHVLVLRFFKINYFIVWFKWHKCKQWKYIRFFAIIIKSTGSSDADIYYLFHKKSIYSLILKSFFSIHRYDCWIVLSWNKKAETYEYKLMRQNMYRFSLVTYEAVICQTASIWNIDNIL